MIHDPVPPGTTPLDTDAINIDAASADLTDLDGEGATPDFGTAAADGSIGPTGVNPLLDDRLATDEQNTGTAH